MKQCALQIFLFAAIALFFSTAPVRGALSIGSTYSFSFVDIDGNKLSTADGHLTVLVLATTTDWGKPRAVGERVPDSCLGNPDYRMITIIRFVRKHGAIVSAVARGVVRRRVNEEATRLQTRYNAKNIARNARSDIFVVTDFDGTASSQLDGGAEGAGFRVLVFGRDGKLLAQWTDVPSAKQLAEVLK